MKKFYLFMLIAVGLLISTTMSAMPERPVPPEPKAPEGVEMSKPEMPEAPKALAEAPVVAPVKAPNKAAMGEEPALMAILYREGSEPKKYAYTSDDLVALQTEMIDGDLIVMQIDLDTCFNLSADVVLDLNGHTIESDYARYAVYIETDANVTIKNGKILTYHYQYLNMDGSWSGQNTFAIYVASGNIKLDNVTISSYCAEFYNDPSKGSYYGIYTSGSVEMSNCHIDAYKYGIYSSGSKTLINEGTEIEVPNNYAIYLETGHANFQMKGGYIKGWLCFWQYYMDISITGGTLEDGGVQTYSSVNISEGIDGEETTIPIIKNVDFSGFYGGSKLNITGGIFDSQDNVLPEGYKYQDNGDDTYTVVKDEPLVARIGDQKYYSVADAVNEAEEGKDVIYLIRDIAGDVEISKNVTLNIASHNIEGTLIATPGKTVMVDGKGTIKALSGVVKIIRAFTEVDPTNYLADGSKFEKKSDNLYRVYPEKVAKMEVGGKETFYETVVAAFAALPENSTPATITLLADEYMEYVGKANTVAQYHNTTLDLNGHVIYGTTDYPTSSSAVIINNGTLTVKDGSQSQTGAIYNSHTNPEDWASLGKTYPSYSYSTFMNNSTGTLIIESGYFNNVIYPSGDAQKKGYACYVIDNYNGKVIINGGTLYNQNTFAIRMWCTSTQNEVTINGGEIYGGTGAIQLHLPSNGGSPYGTLTINGGIITGNDNSSIALYSHGYKTNNVTITVNNGATLNGYIDLYTEIKELTTDQGATVNVTGGLFNIDYYGITTWDVVNDNNCLVTGGTFYSYDKNAGYTDGLIHYDYFAKYVPSDYCITEWQDANQVWWKTVEACNVITIDENTTITNPDQYDSSDVLEIKGNGEEANPVTVTIGDDKGTPIEVNVNTIKGDGEAQIVVKDGAVLNVGNGGLVSENNKLVFIKVEAGGKMTVGNGGVGQEGELYPIIIEHDSDKSGVYMVSPDAQINTEPEATVRVYTRAYMTTALRHWQQIAIPVKNHFEKDVNNGITIKFDQLGGQKSSNPDHITTDFYHWTYAKDDWEFMTTFENEWNTKDLKPFEAYDLINNSLPSEKGVTYEFKGDLVGNKDLELIFPEHGYCLFGNSYTAPISLQVLFETTKKYIKGDNVDYAVWIFNSEKDRYETVNELMLEHPKMCPFTEIPPQEVFLMNLVKGNTGATVVDYRKAIWENQNSETVNKPIRAPKEEYSEYNSIANIVISTENDADHVLIMEGNQFDANYNSGADASKYMDRGHFNFYASTDAGELAILATDNLEGTYFTLQTEADLDYKLSFDNVKAEGYYMKDLLTEQMIPMQEGYEYSFVAQPNTTAQRFIIVRAPAAPTNMDKVEHLSAQKGVYTILGQYLGEKAMWNKLSSGVYVIDGIKMVK